MKGNTFVCIALHIQIQTAVFKTATVFQDTAKASTVPSWQDAFSFSAPGRYENLCYFLVASEFKVNSMLSWADQIIIFLTAINHFSYTYIRSKILRQPAIHHRYFFCNRLKQEGTGKQRLLNRITDKYMLFKYFTLHLSATIGLRILPTLQHTNILTPAYE
jgi:hypothetical protein